MDATQVKQKAIQDVKNMNYNPPTPLTSKESILYSRVFFSEGEIHVKRKLKST
jgi:hypothetical protein